MHGKVQRIAWVEGFQHHGILQNAVHPQHANAEKPQHGDFAEQPADFAGAVFLHQKQPDQNTDGNRQNHFLELRGRHAQTFHRRQHRNGRGDDGVAIKQRGGKNPGGDDVLRQTRTGMPQPVRQRRQRQHAAFTLIVKAQYQGHIFQRHDQHHAPEQNRQSSEDIGLAEWQRVAAREGFLERVQRTGADVAIDHP